MSSLLDAANVTPNKMEVTDQLPEHIGDVSIMTIEQAFKALENSHRHNDSETHYDPIEAWYCTKYCIYGIAGPDGTDSTAENLQDIGLDWYKQFNIPTSHSQIFTHRGKTIFGGPLFYVSYIDGGYGFNWCDDEAHNNYSCLGKFWGSDVDPSVYIAIVEAHEHEE